MLNLFNDADTDYVHIDLALCSKKKKTNGRWIRITQTETTISIRKSYKKLKVQWQKRR